MWSAGFASEDQQALPEAAAAMAEVGIALRPHRTRLLDTGQCRRADLVAAMTRRHVIGVALVSLETWPRTVPLGDLLAQARRVGPAPGLSRPGTGSAASTGSASAPSCSPSPEADVPDPVGAPLQAFVALRDQLQAGASELAGLLGGEPAP